MAAHCPQQIEQEQYAVSLNLPRYVPDEELSFSVLPLSVAFDGWDAPLPDEFEEPDPAL